MVINLWIVKCGNLRGRKTFLSNLSLQNSFQLYSLYFRVHPYTQNYFNFGHSRRNNELDGGLPTRGGSSRWYAPSRLRSSAGTNVKLDNHNRVQMGVSNSRCDDGKVRTWNLLNTSDQYVVPRAVHNCIPLYANNIHTAILKLI